MPDLLLKSNLCQILFQLSESIKSLSIEEYTKKIRILSNTSIGEHSLHIIESLEQLLLGYDSGLVRYDEKQRDIRLQENTIFACKIIDYMISNIDKNDKKIALRTHHNKQDSTIESTYLREIVFIIEHGLHHLAFIKIGLHELGNHIENEYCGIIKSPIRSMFDS